MSNNKHTPGPWIPMINLDGRTPTILCYDKHKQTICEIHCNDDETDEAEANIRLIASAPALKEENERLKEALEVIKKMTDNSAIRIKINQALNKTK